MSAEPVLSVLFLWHQHQPFYKDPLSNRYELPWVRLHATKDYYDMVALLEEFPKIRSNFNLVPSLLTQLEDYAQGKAHDKFLALSRKPAAELSFEERRFILQNFFMANWQNMIDPYPRYRELLDRRGRSGGEEELARAHNYFKEQDWRDLQVWFNLAWFDPYWREKDDFVRGLYDKGKGFDEGEKNKLLDRQLEICGQVASKHKEMADKGQIEVTATPFYHPILPLLTDTDCAKVAMPQVNLPKNRFQHPEDAREQIDRALRFHESRFGRRPQGMWPSEGSVSEPVAATFTELGVRWIATDEAVLARSLAPAPFKREDIYEPYQLMAGGKPLHFFFRDHELSDAIGFVYSSWKPEDAAANFVERLHEIRKRLIASDGAHPRPHVIPVILDGENCWEYYRQDGLPFLRDLYHRLSEDPLLRTVRAGDYLDEVKEVRKLEHLWPASWINGNFGIWIGHSEDNLAWDYLSRTRDFLVRWGEEHPDTANSDAMKLAWEEIYIAEGSDWCWWYGDDHSSGNDDAFDYLFRKHLMNVYSVLGAKIPEDLHTPIKRKRSKSIITPPVDFITPQLDGKITSYFEWQPAGSYQTEAGATGTMHRAQNLIKTIFFGFDLQNLYFRIDLSRPADRATLEGYLFRLIFSNPEGYSIEGRLGGGTTFELNLKGPASESKVLPPGATQKIIEFSIPLNALPTPPGRPFQFVLQVSKDNIEQERWPVETTISIPYPSEEAFAESWII